jgi:TonB dependent receptor
MESQSLYFKYPYNPFYGGITPRVGFAWNARPNTIIRGGYARIYGRINGVNPILVPMLTPGLMQPATCGGPNITTGLCGGDPTDVFRVGVDGVNAPLPPPVASLPQPWYPGLNAAATGAGETIDPNFHPNRNDEVTLSVQHQLSPRILAEVRYIGRKLSNEIQYYSLTAVPYMMTGRRAVVCECLEKRDGGYQLRYKRAISHPNEWQSQPRVLDLPQFPGPATLL